jgi:hypothetical protein
VLARFFGTPSRLPYASGLSSKVTTDAPADELDEVRRKRCGCQPFHQDWLGRHAMARSAAMAPAARIKCSSSERFKDALSFRRAQNADERRRLPQAARALSKIGHDRENVHHRQRQYLAPLLQIAGRRIGGAGKPVRELALRNRQELLILLYLARNHAVQRKTARIQEPMVREWGKASDLLTREPAPNLYQPSIALTGAKAAHAFGGREGMCIAASHNRQCNALRG